MTTIKLTIEYDGSRYPGFSTKKKNASIESKLTLAIRDVTGQSTQLFAAVKTEPGVHATHQIVSFQLEKESFSDNTELLKMKLNAALPADIAVTSLEIADERFVASLAVKSCTYTCRIATDPAAALFSRPSLLTWNPCSRQRSFLPVRMTLPHFQTDVPEKVQCAL